MAVKKFHSAQRRASRFLYFILGTCVAVFIFVVVSYQKAVATRIITEFEPGLTSSSQQRTMGSIQRIQRRTNRSGMGNPTRGDTVKFESLKSWNEHYLDQFKKTVASHKNAKHVHTFVTMDCTEFSLWQVIMLEHSWKQMLQSRGKEQSNHQNHFHRLVSGCPVSTTHTNRKLTESMTHTIAEGKVDDDDDVNNIIGVVSTFFVPKFDVLPNGEKYVQYNRPNALWYWLNRTSSCCVGNDDVLMNLDPDMFFVNSMDRITEGVVKGMGASQDYDYMHAVDFSAFAKPSRREEYN
eukprot:PhF_6_TR40167/c0_g1_i4/m.59500